MKKKIKWISAAICVLFMVTAFSGLISNRATALHSASSTIAKNDACIEKETNSPNPLFSGGVSPCTKFLLFDWDGTANTAWYIDPEPTTHGPLYISDNVWYNLTTKLNPSSPVTGFIMSFPWYWIGFPNVYTGGYIQGFTGIIIRIGNLLLGCGICIASEGAAWI